MSEPKHYVMHAESPVRAIAATPKPAEPNGAIQRPSAQQELLELLRQLNELSAKAHALAVAIALGNSNGGL